MPIGYTINWTYIIIGGVIIYIADTVSSFILGYILGYLSGKKSKKLEVKIKESK